MGRIQVHCPCGAGEPLFASDAGLPDRNVCTDDVATDALAHMVIERAG
jgi:hypothetical protein